MNYRGLVDVGKMGAEASVTQRVLQSRDHCIRVFFYFVWFVFIHHNFQFYFKLCTYCNILDIYLS